MIFNESMFFYYFIFFPRNVQLLVISLILNWPCKTDLKFKLRIYYLKKMSEFRNQ
jgi:hypothetical protein